MDFDLSPEQSLLKDSVGRLMADHYAFEKRKTYIASADGWSREMWARYAELGILGLPFAEAQGGFSGGAVETMIVMEAMGRALTVEPYLATVVLAGGALRHGASAEQLAALVPGVAQGKTILALAHAEREARYDLASVAATARREGNAWRIDGEKTLVLHGDAADRFVVSARISGNPSDESGIALFLVDAKAPGLSRRAYPTQDAMRAAEVTFAGVRVADDAAIGAPGAGFPILRRVAEDAIAALAAEAVGAMAELTSLTVEYLKTRRQFGVAIGSFQALQHRASDMLIAEEQARSMALFATMMAEDTDDAGRARALAAAKVQIGRSGRFVAQQAIQLHGGIGMTMEYKAGHYMKRLAMIDLMFGDADHHLRALARAGGLLGDAA
ncbi:MAG TPA: acyl-CoA dehydrogenase family protein [Stellaceae bacterium]|nr:acyl-CoA dehydrogenase family protein [Stellaceae bacterium]